MKISLKTYSLARPIAASILLAGILMSVVLTSPVAAQPIEDFEDPTTPVTSAQLQSLQKELDAAKPKVSSIPSDPSEKTSCNIFSDGIGCAIYWVLDIVSDFLINIILSWVVIMFESAIQIASAPLASFQFVKIGFGITLGVANMFFVLILLWIAIATIFDFEPYTARQLLLKLILAALLINFSLPIGSAFINLSNGIAKIFYSQLQRPLTAEEQSQQGVVGRFMPLAPIASRILLASKFSAIKDPQQEKNAPTSELALNQKVRANIIRDCYTQLGPIPGIGAIPCLNTIFNSMIQTSFRIPPNDQGLLEIALTATLFKLVITPILIFVLLAGAVFLITRTLSLAFLLVMGPLAFLFMILPATQAYYRQWWERLTKWSFFFPTFMFFIFLSLQSGSSFAQAFVTAGASDRLPAFLQYTFFVGLLLGSLIVANQMSIYGAGTVTGFGKKLAGASGKWAKGTGKILGAGAAGGVLGSVVGQRLASNRYTRWALRPVEAARAAGQKVREEREKTALQRRGLAAKVSPQYRWALMRGMAPSERADFIRQSKPHELRSMLNSMTPGDRIALHNEMRPFDVDEKLIDATQDLTAAIEMETGVERTDTRFQDAFNSWIGSASKHEIQKYIQPQDIRANINLQTAIRTEGILDIEDFRTMGNSPETAQAMRDFVAMVGSGSVENGLNQLALTNRSLVEKIRSTPGVAIKLERGIALGKKAPKERGGPPPPEPPPAAPSGGGAVA